MSGHAETEHGERPSLIGANPDRLAEVCRELCERPFRARQLAHWLYQRRVGAFDEMTDLPKAFRASLAAAYSARTVKALEARAASDGTAKLLVGLRDGEAVECVLMPESSRLTLCVSTQVGCAMGCAFCASARLRFRRNLTAGEMIEQVFLASEHREGTGADAEHGASDQSRRSQPAATITNIVFMGIGEPLANVENLFSALDSITSPWGMGIGARRVTVSTVGLPDAMLMLARRFPQVNLAVSLHAADDETRSRIVPANQKHGIDAVLEAVRSCFRIGGREITVEYVLLKSVNDSVAAAHKLAGRLRCLRVNVNLIPLNPAPGIPFEPPPEQTVGRFASVLKEHGVNVHVRRARGADISAACGQLRLAAGAD